MAADIPSQKEEAMHLITVHRLLKAAFDDCFSVMEQTAEIERDTKRTL